MNNARKRGWFRSSINLARWRVAGPCGDFGWPTLCASASRKGWVPLLRSGTHEIPEDEFVGLLDVPSGFTFILRDIQTCGLPTFRHFQREEVQGFLFVLPASFARSFRELS